VQGYSGPTPLRTDIWQPALTEAKLKGKGLFVLSRNVFSSILREGSVQSQGHQVKVQTGKWHRALGGRGTAL